MSVERSGFCWNCRKGLLPNEYGRQDVCSQCGQDTRVCKGCEYYDSSMNNGCREPQADRVVDKEKANFCDYFKPNPSQLLHQGTATGVQAAQTTLSSRDSLKAMAENLFKKK
jgi:hypothetical protein